MAKRRTPTCICGHPCRDALFNSFEGCTNPKCKWFDNKTIRDMQEAERAIRDAFALSGLVP